MKRRRVLAALMLHVLLLLLAVPARGQNLFPRITSAEELVDGRYVLVFSGGAAPGDFRPERGVCLPAFPRQAGQDALIPQPDALWQLTFCQDGMGVVLRTANEIPLAPAEDGRLRQGEWIWQLHARGSTFSLSARVGEKTYWLARDPQSGSFGLCAGETPEGDSGFFLYREVAQSPSPAPMAEGPTAPAIPQRDSLGRRWYLGQLHGHSSYSGGGQTPQQIFSRVRAAGQLDFYALTDYAPALRTGSRWQTGKEAAKDAADENFLPLWGYETFSLPEQQTGHFGVLGTDSLVEAEALCECYEALSSAAGALGQFNHPGTEYGNFRQFSGYSLSADAVMQLLEVEGRKGKFREAEYIAALDAGWHIAPTAGQEGRPGGTMVLAENLTEESILSALKSRRVYATRDSDLYIDFSLSGYPMGSVLRSWDLEQEPTVRLRLYDPTDARSMEVEVISRGGLCVASYHWDGETLTFPLPTGSDWYYLKITQPDGDIALTAPVWIDWQTYAGISDFSVTTRQPVQNRQAQLGLELFNREEIPLQITAIQVTGEGESMLSMEEEISILPGQTQSIPLSILCPARAETRLQVTVTARQGERTKLFESSLTLSCREEAPFAAIRAVKQEQPGLEFRIRGRVTACNLWDNMLMVQDGTGAIAVTPVNPEDFAVGHRVEIRGSSEQRDGLWLMHPVSVEKCADTGYTPQPEVLTPAQVRPDSPMLGMLVSMESTCISGSDGTLFLQCPGGSPLPLWGKVQSQPETGKNIRVTGILWKKDGQTGIYLQSLAEIETVEEAPVEEPTDKKSVKKTVTSRAAENPDVGDPLPRWLIQLLMRKEMLWNCMIR